MKLPALAFLIIIAASCFGQTTTYSNINAVSLYGDWQYPPTTGPTYVGGTGTTSAYSQTNGISSPSLDGQSMELSMTCAAEGTPGETCNTLWPYILPADDAASTFQGKFSVNLPAVTNIQALEYDIFQRNAYLNMFGSQCSSPTFADGLWQIWNPSAPTWVNTSVPCTLLTTASVWHTITWNVHWFLGSCSGAPVCLSYDMLTVDGVQYTGFPVQPGVTQGGSHVIGIQFQIDQAYNAGTTIEYLDEAGLTVSQPSVPRHGGFLN
jgi:hypothetical protein